MAKKNISFLFLVLIIIVSQLKESKPAFSQGTSKISCQSANVGEFVKKFRLYFENKINENDLEEQARGLLRTASLRNTRSSEEKAACINIVTSLAQMSAIAMNGRLSHFHTLNKEREILTGLKYFEILYKSLKGIQRSTEIGVPFDNTLRGYIRSLDIILYESLQKIKNKNKDNIILPITLNSELLLEKTHIETIYRVITVNKYNSSYYIHEYYFNKHNRDLVFSSKKFNSQNEGQVKLGRVILDLIPYSTRLSNIFKDWAQEKRVRLVSKGGALSNDFEFQYLGKINFDFEENSLLTNGLSNSQARVKLRKIRDAVNELFRMLTQHVEFTPELSNRFNTPAPIVTMQPAPQHNNITTQQSHFGQAQSQRIFCYKSIHSSSLYSLPTLKNSLPDLRINRRLYRFNINDHVRFIRYYDPSSPTQYVTGTYESAYVYRWAFVQLYNGTQGYVAWNKGNGTKRYQPFKECQ